MNLTCPSCDTTFRVEPAQFGAARRRVRCGGCNHEWDQARPKDEAEAGAAPEAEPEAEPEPEAPYAEAARDPGPRPIVAERAARRSGIRPDRPPQGTSGHRVAAGWIVFLLVLGGLAAGGYYAQPQILAAVPAAAALYRLVGLEVAPPLGEGLELREVKSVRRMIDGQGVVVIEGLVANVSDRPRDVPSLRASVLNAGGDQVDEWVFSANSTVLPPGAVTEFKTTTRNAPRDGTLGIDFVASNDK